jgi:hypothetical protein
LGRADSVGALRKPMKHDEGAAAYRRRFSHVNTSLPHDCL